MKGTKLFLVDVICILPCTKSWKRGNRGKPNCGKGLPPKPGKLPPHCGFGFGFGSGAPLAIRTRRAMKSSCLTEDILMESEF